MRDALPILEGQGLGRIDSPRWAESSMSAEPFADFRVGGGATPKCFPPGAGTHSRKLPQWG